MKGQISFDLILALILALTLIQSLTSFSDNFLKNQERINIRFQEKQIADEIHHLLLYAKTLKKGENIAITHQIEKIRLSGPAGQNMATPIECNVTIGAANITVDVNNSHYPTLGSETISETILNDSGITMQATNCGKIIKITKAHTG